MLKQFRDIMAILLGVIVFPTLWALEGLGIINVPNGMLVATLPLETLIIQFYFRKAPSTETPNDTEG